MSTASATSVAARLTSGSALAAVMRAVPYSTSVLAEMSSRKALAAAVAEERLPSGAKLGGGSSVTPGQKPRTPPLSSRTPWSGSAARHSPSRGTRPCRRLGAGQGDAITQDLVDDRFPFDRQCLEVGLGEDNNIAVISQARLHDVLEGDASRPIRSRYDGQVDVAVRPGLSASDRPEEHDSLHAGIDGVLDDRREGS